MSRHATTVSTMPSESPRFSSNKLFSGIAPDLVAELEIIPEPVDFAPDVVIFREGEPAECLFLIAEGEVRISKRGRGGRQETLSSFGRDDFFGEMAIYDPAPRSAQATTLESTSLGRVRLDGLERMLELAPLEISANLTREFIRRLRRMDALLIRELIEAERLSLVGSMAAGIAHDFIDPIGTIGMSIQMLEAQSDDSTTRHWTEMIRRSVEMMQTMTRELVDYSKGDSSLDLQEVTVGEILMELEEQALNRLAESNIQVKRKIEYEGRLTVDRNRFTRLLLNLVRNAAEVMVTGGELEISVDRSGERVRFHIEDTGGGVSEEVLPRIFQPFVTHGKRKGTGLGLAIAKSVVEAHGGTISIINNPGVGAHFLVEMPERPVKKGG